MSEQKFYLVRDGAGTSKVAFSIIKEKPDPSKFKFLRINPSNSHVEEWVPIEEYDNPVKPYEKDGEK
jgi:hypothetical protein